MTGTHCTCVPCVQPGGGVHPGEHCAGCCSGSLIEEYDFHCPIESHREWAAKQFPGVHDAVAESQDEGPTGIAAHKSARMR